MSARRGGEHDAISEMVREIGAETPSEPDWEQIERRLMRRIAERDPAPARSPFWRVAGLSLAAAVVLATIVGVRIARRTDASPSVAVAPAPLAATSQSPFVDGDALHASERVVARAVPRTVDHPGRARWVLAPSSRATVLMHGDTVVVRLDSGSLEASVVPVRRSESFVVEAAAVRVAVHGTRFRVERRSGHVFVNVSEGAVKVTPIAGGDTNWMLKAGSNGDFAEDGSSGEVVKAVAVKGAPRPRALPSPSFSSAESDRHEDVQAEAGVREEPSDVPPAELPDRPSSGDLEEGLSRVIDSVTRCFDKHRAPGDTMRVTARTTLKLTIAPDGSISAQSFDPPLSPTVSACGVLESERVRFSASREGLSVTRILELGQAH